MVEKLAAGAVVLHAGRVDRVTTGLFCHQDDTSACHIGL